jgi:PleD family two-component response regulator
MVNLNIESELCKDLICNPNDRQRNSQEHREGTLIMSKGSRILIVDDEPDVLELLEYKLREAGYVIVLAEDGQQALEKARNERPDIILLDLMLPEVDGLKVCKALKLAVSATIVFLCCWEIL